MRVPSKSVLGIMIAGILVAACSNEPQPLEIATVMEDGVTVHFVNDVCTHAGSVQETVVEGAASVIVSYEGVTKEGDCATAGSIVLAAPLGDRVLVDGFHNHPIPLTPHTPSG